MTLVIHEKIRYYPITFTLQISFMSPKIAEHMIWYHSHDVVDEVMLHSSDGDVLKHFNRVHP